MTTSRDFNDGQYEDQYCIPEDQPLEDAPFPWSIPPFFTNYSDTDERSYSPQISCNYTLSSVVGTNSEMDTLPTLHILCDDCVKPASSKGKKHPYNLSSMPPDLWLLDLGTSTHFTNDLKDFVEYIEYDQP